VKSYLKVVRDLNNNSGKLRLYPGSPCCAAPLLRADDRMRLFELHPADCRLLRKTFEDAAARPSCWSRTASPASTPSCRRRPAARWC
jgi:23S rRNA (adenine2030-N6)-methyltransferase